MRYLASLFNSPRIVLETTEEIFLGEDETITQYIVNNIARTLVIVMYVSRLDLSKALSRCAISLELSLQSVELSDPSGVES